MTQHFVRFLFAVITACAAFVASATQWQTIVPAQAGLLNASGQLVDGNDAALTDSSGEPLIPKCVAPEDMGGPFRFFVQAGDPDKLLLFHSGGGACWNAATCASGLGLIPGVARSYSPVIFETPELLAKAGGVLDPEQSTNPFAKWTKVYIPYCTGDVGWGNRDMHYGLQLPDGRPFPISHRGYANVRTVTEWLKRHFQATGSQPRKVVVSGSSAGGYAAIGTLFNETVDVVGRSADMSVIGDSANGVVTDGFLQSARQEGIRGNITCARTRCSEPGR